MKKNLVALLFLLSVNMVVYAQEWNTDFKEVQVQASKEHKNIILVFSGSDWCAPCIKLEKSIFQSEAFKKTATNEYVLLRADFPKRKKNKLSEQQQKHNNELAALYNQEGYFPLVVVLDSQGKVLGKTGYKNTTPEAYISLLQSFEK
ncbi:thioredoxin family protein [Kordia zhangzhouensis]|uniref:thioredoxin family protein n=1 Tax=Kordia zhangzhouensis TaxID=1620405 RepID=UPI0006291E2B|nr:thioredoxin family protein [Kordia zhangzhouensis]